MHARVRRSRLSSPLVPHPSLASSTPDEFSLDVRHSSLGPEHAQFRTVSCVLNVHEPGIDRDRGVERADPFGQRPPASPATGSATRKARTRSVRRTRTAKTRWRRPACRSVTPWVSPCLSPTSTRMTTTTATSSGSRATTRRSVCRRTSGFRLLVGSPSFDSGTEVNRSAERRSRPSDRREHDHDGSRDRTRGSPGRRSWTDEGLFLGRQNGVWTRR